MKKKEHLLFEIATEIQQVKDSVARLTKSLNDLNDKLPAMGQPALRTEEITQPFMDPDFLEERLLPSDTTKLFGFPIKREAARQMVHLPEGAEDFKKQALAIRETLRHSQMQAHPDMFIAKNGRIEVDPAKLEAALDTYRRYAQNDAEKKLWDRALAATKEAVAISKELNNSAVWITPSGSLQFNQFHLYEVFTSTKPSKGPGRSRYNQAGRLV